MLAPAMTETDLRELTWEYCGIARSGGGLASALNALERIIWEPMETPGLPAIELRNMHEVAGLIARGALWREESRGAHYRTDFPEKDPAFVRPSLLVRKHTAQRA